MDNLLIVGDGPVSEALAPMAELLGWRPSTVASLDDALAALPGSAAVVVLSHHDDVDAPALAAALRSDVGYIGAMGSRRTQTRRREWLSANGVAEADQARIHGPAGIDIGADGPPEIALSILAELVAVVRGGSAGSLKDRPGPIHPELGPGEATCPTG
jgi:xanthine/CO dehydrogenase XdhC/CoxF family maturation factor